MDPLDVVVESRCCKPYQTPPIARATSRVITTGINQPDTRDGRCEAVPPSLLSNGPDGPGTVGWL